MSSTASVKPNIAFELRHGHDWRTYLIQPARSPDQFVIERLNFGPVFTGTWKEAQAAGYRIEVTLLQPKQIKRAADDWVLSDHPIPTQDNEPLDARKDTASRQLSTAPSDPRDMLEYSVGICRLTR